MLHEIIAKTLFFIFAIALAVACAKADAPFITNGSKVVSVTRNAHTGALERILCADGKEYSLTDEDAYRAFRAAPAAEKNKYPFLVRREYGRRIIKEIEARRKRNLERRNIKPAANATLSVNTNGIPVALARARLLRAQERQTTNIVTQVIVTGM